MALLCPQRILRVLGRLRAVAHAPCSCWGELEISSIPATFKWALLGDRVMGFNIGS